MAEAAIALRPSDPVRCAASTADAETASTTVVTAPAPNTPARCCDLTPASQSLPATARQSPTPSAPSSYRTIIPSPGNARVHHDFFCWPLTRLLVQPVGTSA